MRIIVLAVLLALALSEEVTIDMGCIKRYMVNKHEAKICEIIAKIATNFTSGAAAKIQIQNILKQMQRQNRSSFRYELIIIMLILFQTFSAIFLIDENCINKQLEQNQPQSYFLECIFIQWQIFLIFEIIDYLNQEEKIKIVTLTLLTIDIIAFLIWFGYIIIKKVKDQSWLEKIGIIVYLLFGLGSCFGYFQVYKKATQMLYIISPVFKLFLCIRNGKMSKHYMSFGIFYLVNIIQWPELMNKEHEQYFSPLPYWLILLIVLAYFFSFAYNSKPIQKRLHVWFNGKTLREYLQIKKKDDEEDIDCSICLQTMRLEEKVYEFEYIQIVNNMAIVQTPCSHFFHKYCLSQWMKQNTKCPLDLSILRIKRQ